MRLELGHRRRHQWRPQGLIGDIITIIITTISAEVHPAAAAASIIAHLLRATRTLLQNRCSSINYLPSSSRGKPVAAHTAAGTTGTASRRIPAVPAIPVRCL